MQLLTEFDEFIEWKSNKSARLQSDRPDCRLIWKIISSSLQLLLRFSFLRFFGVVSSSVILLFSFSSASSVWLRRGSCPLDNAPFYRKIAEGSRLRSKLASWLSLDDCSRQCWAHWPDWSSLLFALQWYPRAFDDVCKGISCKRQLFERHRKSWKASSVSLERHRKVWKASEKQHWRHFGGYWHLLLAARQLWLDGWALGYQARPS